MTGTYQSRSTMRGVGFVLLLTSAILGPYLLATSFGKPIPCPGAKCADTGIDSARFLPAFGLLVAGLPVGIILLTKRDQASISVSPGVTATTTSWQGLTLRAVF